jgi:O-antigen/teichoic acid export membrane protein
VGDRAARSNPLKNILHLAAGDFAARTLSFLAFVYLARVLGVSSFGVLEFAVSILAYLLLIADGGLELWGTSEAAKMADLEALTSQVVSLRLLLAATSFVLLLLLLRFFPAYPSLRLLLVLYGLCVFAQALNLKWVFMGQERMVPVARGLVLAQIIFAAGVFAFIRGPEALVWVPVLRLAGDSTMAAYFAVLFGIRHGKLPLRPTLRGAKEAIRPALTLGASQAMGLLNYNFDSVLLGFLLSATSVGWYTAAYKPVTIAVVLPMTYFIGLFPALSRSYVENRVEFRFLIRHSSQLWLSFAVPLVVGGMLLAGPIIHFLYGSAYSNSVRPFQILVWSAALVSLRWSYMDSLRATGHQHLDLRCAIASASVNVGLNILLIPHFGMVGAASATVTADVVWLVMGFYYFRRHVVPEASFPSLKWPLAAGAAMGCFLWLAWPLPWVVRGLLAALLYFALLSLPADSVVRAWVPFLRRSGPQDPP